MFSLKNKRMGWTKLFLRKKQSSNQASNNRSDKVSHQNCAELADQYVAKYCKGILAETTQGYYQSEKQVTRVLSKVPQGYALFLSFSHFRDDSLAPSCKQNADIFRLRLLLKELNCQVYEKTSRDCSTREALHEFIQQFRDECDRKEAKYIFVYIRAHGTQDKILTPDGLCLQLEQDIFYQFYKYSDKYNPVGAKNLNRTPKIFLVDWHAARIRKCQPLSQTRSLFPNSDNMLVILSEVKCQRSLPDSACSLFTNCLIAVMRKLVSEKSLLDLVHLAQQILLSSELKKYFKIQEYSIPEIRIQHFDTKFCL